MFGNLGANFPLLLGVAACGGFGIYFVVTSLPFGKPRPNLTEQLRRLEVATGYEEERYRRRERGAAQFDVPFLEAFLAPLLQDLGQLCLAVWRALPLSASRHLYLSTAEQEQGLELTGASLTLTQYYGQKAFAALVLLALFLAANLLGAPGAPYPWLVGVVATGIGFFLPDVSLAQKIKARRERIVLELPSLLDAIAISISAGMGQASAILSVMEESPSALLVSDLEQVYRATGTGLGVSPNMALRAMARRNQIPEVTNFVEAVLATSNKGIPLADRLQMQARLLRSRRLAALRAEGGKTAIKLIFPVLVFIMPCIFVVIGWPAVLAILTLFGH